MSVIISDIIEIPAGVVSSGLTADAGEIDILTGGTLTDSFATNEGIIIVNEGGLLQRTSATSGSLIWGIGQAEAITVEEQAQFQFAGGFLNTALIHNNGQGAVNAGAKATAVTVVTGGTFMLDGGSALDTVVSNGGTFIVQSATAEASKTSVLEGGMMQVVLGGGAPETTVNGGFLIVENGTVSGAIISAGTMTVMDGNTVQNTAVNGGVMIISGAATDGTTVAEGAFVSAVSGTLQKTTMAGGNIHAISTAVSDLTMTGGTATLDADSRLFGKSVFAEGVTITVDGTVEFDTQYTTQTEAQITGFSAISGNATKYTLNAEPAVGIYLLATGAASFDGEITFGQETLRLDEDPVKVGELTYGLSLTDGALELTIADYVPEGGTIVFVNSEWSTKKTGDTVEIGGITATIGTDAFATGDEAAATVAEIDDAKIRVAGGTVSFSAENPIAKDTVVYNGATLMNSFVAATGKLVVNKGATLAGMETFAEGANITVNGTVAFDTAVATAEVAQFTGFHASGAMTCTLTVENVQPYGTFLLATGADGFNKTLLVRTTTGVELGELPVNLGKQTVLDGEGYTLTLGEDGVLSLTVEKVTDIDPPIITITADITDPTPTDVVLTAEITDNVGVTSAEYRFGELGEWLPYQLDGVTVKENGTVYFRASDAAGNTAEEQYIVSNINRDLDIDPPTLVAIHVIPEDPTDIAIVTAEFTDNVGVTSEEYRIGELGEWTEYPVSGVTVSENGTLFFRASDAKGNMSDIASITVTNIIDIVGPTLVSITADPATATNQDVVVTAVFTDNVGVVSEEYRIGDAGEWTACVDGSMTATDNCTVFFRASDAAGNMSEVAFFVVDYIDRIPPDQPIVTADVTDPTDKPVTVSAEFSYDSVKREYSLDDGEWGDYPDGGVTVMKNCVVAFRGTDAAGNVSLVTGYTVSNIEPAPVPPEEDTDPPTLSYITANITKPTNKNVTVTASFDDNVGVTYMQYRINDDTWKAYGADGVTLDLNGTVYVRAFDAAGNVSEIASYTVTNIDKSLPDGQAKVFVNPEWANVASGTVVETFDCDYATVGVNAFGTGDEANAAVDASGTIHLDSGTVFFSDAACNIVIHQAALVADNEAGLDNVTIMDNGSITMTKGVMTNCTLLCGGLIVESGAVVDGLTHDSPFDVTVTFNGATVKNAVVGCQMLLFDMDYTCSMSVGGEGGLAQNVEVVKGGRLFVSSGARAENVLLSGDNENNREGEFYVCDGGSASGVTVSSGGYLGCWGGAEANGLVILEGGQAYVRGSGSRAFVSGGILGVEAGAIITDATVTAGGSMWTVNSAGTGSLIDAEIQSDGYLHHAGYASNTQILTGGTMYCLGVAEATEVQGGGKLEICNGTLRDVTVRKDGVLTPAEYCYGGTFTGRVVVEDGATVSLAANQTIDFDISGLDGTEDIPLVSGFSFIEGAPELTLSVSGEEQAAGKYLLATGVGSFEDRAIAFGEYTLTVGGEPVRLGENVMTLNLSGDNLVLSILAPSDIVYESSEWCEFPDGSIVTIDEEAGITAVIGINAFATGDAAVAAAAEGGVVDVISGPVLFNNLVNRDIWINEGATLTGKATFADDVVILNNGTVAFDTAYATATEAQFNGLSAVGDGGATLTIQDGHAVAENSFLLATDAATMLRSEVVYDGFTYSVGAPEFFINEENLSYVLDLQNNGDLVLSFVSLINGPDDGWNDWLYDKKTKTVNYAVTDLAGTTLSAKSYPDVLVDTKGSVYKDGYYNFINATDTTDFTKFTLTDATRLSFTIKATDKVKATICQLVYDTAKAKYILKSLKSASVTVKKDADYGLVDTKAILLAPGEYYLAVQSTNKKATEVFYNVTMNETSHVFLDDDDSTNDYLFVDNKAKNGLTERAKNNDLYDNPIAEDVMGGIALRLDDKTTSEEGWDNFVGFGDVADVARVSPTAPAALDFSVTATDKVKLIVYALTLNSKGAWTAKAIKTKTLTVKKGETEGNVATDTLLLDRLAIPDADKNGVTGYYVAVQSTNAKTGAGGNAYYNVTATGLLYEDADLGANSWLYDKKANAVNSDENLNLEANMELSSGDELFLDKDGVAEEGWSNFVGFGDAADYAAFTVAESGTYQFVFSTTGKAKFSVYSLTDAKGGKKTQKALATQTVKVATEGAQLKKGIVLEAGVTYYVSMEATDAKKGAEVYYNVTANLTSAANSSALDQALFASQSVDSFADASAFIADSQLVDDKQAWQSVAALA